MTKIGFEEWWLITGADMWAEYRDAKELARLAWVSGINPELFTLLKAVLARLDLEPVNAVFPCSAMREDIRKALTSACGISV